MNGHVHEELPLLLRGEANRDAVDEAAAHLRECEDCRQELISALVAHASVSSAARFAPGLIIESTAAIADPSAATGLASPEPGAPGRPELRSSDHDLPDLSALFAQVRAEVDEPASAAGVTGSRPAWRGRWLAAAAVVGLVVGGGAVAASDRLDRGPSARTVQLSAFGAGTAPATVKVVGGDQMKLDAASLPSPGAGKLYEVWLTNAARTQMYAVGSLGADGTGTFTVASDLMGTYSAIEVSVQPLNNSAYSGVSVLRGSYA